MQDSGQDRRSDNGRSNQSGLRGSELGSSADWNGVERRKSDRRSKMRRGNEDQEATQLLEKKKLKQERREKERRLSDLRKKQRLRKIIATNSNS